MELPTHCYSCGAYLMGGATEHKPGCEVLRLIEQAKDDAAKDDDDATPR